jgi:bifunctional UDP-N-acetylglucosamine pyrophosphorylase / glucosamine-1-phosphate N-acetyltransferase
MDKLKVLIAAAGRGSRAGLPYPKTLFQVRGKPILIHLMKLMLPYDNKPIIVVSPDGLRPIQECLSYYGFQAELLIQAEPKGMGDAILCFEESHNSANTKNILLVWGDIPFIQKNTVASLVKHYFDMKKGFAFVTKKVDLAYTLVGRNQNNKVLQVIESREEGLSPQPGERDIGLFIFNKKVVFDLLKKDLIGKYGKKTREHGFLYVIKYVAMQDCNVDALPIATSLDLISLNSLEDLSGYL